MLRCLIVDDEQHARENLAILIEEFCPELKVIGQANGVRTGLEQIAAIEPDVVFLDIRMPSGAEGFELLREVPTMNFMVVFVTAFKDYAIDAFKVNAVDYILKPIDIDELVQTANHLLLRSKGGQDRVGYAEHIKALSEQMLQRSARISISHSTGVKWVRPIDILHLQAEGNCTRIHFKDGRQFLDTRTLAIYEKELDQTMFYRIHRSHLVNIEELEEFSRVDGNRVIMRNGAVLPVARKAVPGLLEFMSKP